MDEAELARRREQMGRGITPWASGPGATSELGDGYWVQLTGAPSPDANMALVSSASDAALTAAGDLVAAAGVPAIFMLAGAAAAAGRRPPGEWQAVGSMPFMALELAGAEVGGDRRVRRAGPDDIDDVVDLMADAFGLERPVAEVVARPLADDGGRSMAFWLLEDDGKAVSTVVSCALDDVVSLWCMSTPARLGRRGYGRALLGAVLAASRDAGAELGLLGATPAGFPLYEATGWRTLEEWELYVNADSAQFST